MTIPKYRLASALLLASVAMGAIAPVTNNSARALVHQESMELQSWARRYQRSAARIEEGTSLAQARLQSLRALIATDPSGVVEQALTPEVYASLPAEIRPNTEIPVSAVGDFHVYCAIPQVGSHEKSRTLRTVMIAGTEYPAVVYGRRLAQKTKYGIPLQGVIIDGTFIVDEHAIQEVDAATLPINTEIRGAKTGVVGRVGGKFYRFESREKLLQIEALIEETEAALAPNPTQTFEQVLDHPSAAAMNSSPITWTTGNKQVLVIRVDFTDYPGDPKNRDATVTKDYAQSIMDTQVKPFYEAASYGKTTMTTTVNEKVYRMPKTGRYYADNYKYTDLLNDAKAAAYADFPRSYDRYIVVFSDLGGQFTFAGLGSVVDSPVWVNGEFSLRVVAHEEGHNMGAGHANYWTVTDGNPISPTGTEEEYGDNYDIMGVSGNGIFNPRFLEMFGWLASTQLQTVTQSGTFRLYQFDVSTRPASDLVALKYTKDSNHTYYISFRGGFKLLNANTPTNIDRAAYVQWTSSSNGYETDLLDMGVTGAGTEDAGLVVGSTFNDLDKGFGIKVLGTGGDAGNRYLDVQVTIFDPQRMPRFTLRNAVVGATATITTTTPTTPLRTQLLVDGISWQESTQSNPTFTWEPSSIGSHAICIRVTYPDGTQLENGTVTTVGFPDAWTFVTPQPNASNGKTVTFGRGAWWIMQDNGAIINSPDGATWTAMSLPYRVTLNGIAGDDNQVIVACSNWDNVTKKADCPTLWRTTDGKTWLTADVGLKTYQNVFYIDNTWILVGEINKLTTSKDGYTWTAPALLPKTSYETWCSIKHINNTWVAIATNGDVATSPDLLAWTKVTTIRPNIANLNGVAYANGSWFVCGYDRSSVSFWMTSPDLVTWKNVPSPDGATYTSKAFDVNGTIVYAAYSALYTSADAQSWTKIALQNSSLNALNYHNGTYLGTGAFGKPYKGTSLNALSVADTYYRSSFYSGIAASDGSTILTTNSYNSTTGKNGTSIFVYKDGVLSTTAATNASYGLAVLNGTYVAVGDSGKVLTSTDGHNWTVRANTGTRLWAVTNLKNTLIAVGEKGSAITSTDSQNWYNRSTGTSKDIKSAATDGKTLVAVGTRGLITTTTDGISWTIQPSPTTSDLNQVVWQVGIGFCALDSSSKLYVSPDGSNWALKPIGNWYALAATPYGLALGSYNNYTLTPDGTDFSATSTAPFSVSHLFFCNNTLFASNGAGLAALSFKAAEQTAVAITTQPASQNVKEGQPAIFTVQTYGSGPVSYQWYRSSSPIAGAISSALVLSNAQKSDAGTYYVVATNPVGSVQSSTVALAVEENAVHIVGAPCSQASCIGGNVTFNVNATGDGPLSYQWYANGQPIAGATSATLTLSNVSAQSYGSYTVKVSSASGSITSSPASLAPSAVIQSPASSLTMLPNATYAFTVRDVIPGGTYRWYNNGIIIAGANGPTLLGKTLTAGTKYVFTVAVAINGVSTTSDPITVQTDDATNFGHLTNVSVLTLSGKDANALTVGFVSNDAKPVLIRAIGPTLSDFSVTNVLPDPILTLFNSASSAVAVNNDWAGQQSLTDAFHSTGAFGLPGSSKDAAMLTTINGLYSGRVDGTTAAPSGKTLIEVYDTTIGNFSSSTPRLVNLSCRCLAGPDDQIVTVGFVISGDNAKTVLIRTSGPALANFGVSGTLKDPTITLYAAGNPVAANDNWGATVPSSVFNTTGAFGLSDSNSKDAAMVVTLPPGLYTVQIAPTQATEALGGGIVLTEVYEVQ